MSYIIGIDVGGTFTDATLIDTTTWQVFTAKSPSTPDDLSRGVFACLDDLSEAVERPVEEILSETVKLAHGTTQTSNVIITRTGSKVGLLTTRGFGDQILIMGGRGRVDGLSLMERRHFRSTDKPEPIVPRRYIKEISERIDYKGSAIVPLDMDEVARATEALVKADVKSVAIALLWAFKNDAHEQTIGDFLAERYPDLYVSLSSKVSPVLGEYERTATTVVNAYVGPAVIDYLVSLEEALIEKGLACPLLILQANGGVAEVGETLPVNTIESGPAAGVVGVKHLGDIIGEQNIICTDVGGTTFKVSLIRNGEWSYMPLISIGQYSTRIPAIDVVSIGAGGGSIAWVDHDRLRVGPISAAANPGPACYDWGGTEPTVTDADLVLGYINPEYFLGGKMALRRDLAEQALKSKVADQLFEGDVVAAAAGIRNIIDAQIADLIRKTTIERGFDPREFVVMAYGGSGPIHCGAYAAELGVEKVIIPPDATVYSAYGAAVSDIRHTYQVSDRVVAPGDPAQIQETFSQLKEKAEAALTRENVSPKRVRLAYWLDMRYQRQFFAVRVPFLKDGAEKLTYEDLEALVSAFKERYVQLYGAGARHRGANIEMVTFGLDAIGLTDKPSLEAQSANGSGPVQPLGQRDVYWPALGGFAKTPIYRGRNLPVGTTVEGPTVIEHVGTSVVVHPNQKASIDPYLNTILHLEAAYERPSEPRHL